MWSINLQSINRYKLDTVPFQNTNAEVLLTQLQLKSMGFRDVWMMFGPLTWQSNMQPLDHQAPPIMKVYGMERGHASPHGPKERDHGSKHSCNGRCSKWSGQ